VTVFGITVPTQIPSVWDPRWLQFSSLAVFCFAGKYILDFRVTTFQIFSALAVCIAIEIFFVALQQRILIFPTSAVISGFGLGFLLRSDTIWIHSLCAALSVGSKYLVRIEGKHVWNPTNFGLVMVLLAFPDSAWATTGQWGTWFIILYGIANAGLFVVYRAKRFHVVVSFWLPLFILLVAQAHFTSMPMDTAIARVTSGALILYTFFMITDPRTTPNTMIGRIGFSLAVSVLTFILFVAEIEFAPFFALFFISGFTPLVDYLMPARRFEWIHVSTPIQLSGTWRAVLSRAI
jgi:Na+-translocating ferredoxin:NAD+ oxidoreductase RnfD subunit